jgi:tRNA pseudouridine55 synthase
MHGVLNLLKPPGMTSHDAVAFVRRVVGVKRVGHTGTLDPAAAGVLPICVGQATRLVEYLQAGRKEYIAEATFGYETDTLDATGTIINESDAGHVTLESLRAALDPFRGTIQQTPPLYSAIKQGGKKLYELARAGIDAADVEIQSREVTVHRLFPARFSADMPRPRAMLHITCSSGTYIRSLVRDIGRRLGCGATMTFLVRTSSGSFILDEAWTVEQIAENVGSALIPLPEALRWCTRRIVVDDKAAQLLAQGQRVVASVPSRMDLEEAKKGFDEYKERRAQAYSQAHANGADWNRVLFLDTANILGVLATPVESPVEPVEAVEKSWYKPDKVFHFDSVES